MIFLNVATRKFKVTHMACILFLLGSPSIDSRPFLMVMTLPPYTYIHMYTYVQRDKKYTCGIPKFHVEVIRKKSATRLSMGLLLFSCSVMSKSLWPQGLQHTRLPSPSLSPRVCSNSCPLNQWCHPTISSSVVLSSSCFQSFPASGYFLRCWLITSGGQSIGASTSA